MIENPPPNCNRIGYNEIKNLTEIIYGFEGIPQNFTINIVVFAISFGLFCVLRKRAWNYGRIALISTFTLDKTENVDYNVWKTLTISDRSESSISLEEVNEKSRLRKFSDSEMNLEFDKGIFSWLKFFYTISDENIKDKAGSDAYQYLLFQKYLIVVIFFISLTSLVVILPINMHGNGTNVKYNDFATTTILNLSSNSSMIWVHSILSFMFFLGIICAIWHYVTKLKIANIQEVSNTLLIDGIPKHSSFRSIILEHFKEAYAECEIKEIQFAHDMRKVIYLNTEREIAIHVRNEANDQYISTGIRRKIVPRFCGRFLTCCVEEVDLIEYYNNEIFILESKCQREIIKAYENKIGVAFVTFEKLEDARKIVEDYQTQCYMQNHPRPSAKTKEIQSAFWTVSYAPHSNIINWENICHSYQKWLIKAILINTIVFTFLFILTTPNYLLYVLQMNFTFKNRSMNIAINRLLPTLIMWAISALLPFLVYYSEILIGHWTKTSEHMSVILKTYTYLIIMVLILPSLGITSLYSFLKWLIQSNDGTQSNSDTSGSDHYNKFILPWLCIYAPGNCAFFVNYVINSAFIGTIADLLRIPELILYLYYQIVLNSSVEMWEMRKNVVWEFQFGLCYSWMLCVFAITITYSVICPIVTPFGFIYMVLKYFVDKYNIYFAYERSFINAKIHRVAMSFTVFSFILLQLNLLIYLYLNKTRLYLVYIFVFTSFILSLLLFMLLTYHGWFTQIKTQEVTNGNLNQIILPTTILVPSLLSTMNLIPLLKK